MQCYESDPEMQGDFRGPGAAGRVQAKWETLADTLNKLGGAFKTGEKWKEAFANLKTRATQQYNQHARYAGATGGGPPPPAQLQLNEVYCKALEFVRKEQLHGHQDVADALVQQLKRQRLSSVLLQSSSACGQELAFSQSFSSACQHQASNELYSSAPPATAPPANAPVFKPPIHHLSESVDMLTPTVSSVSDGLGQMSSEFSRNIVLFSNTIDTFSSTVELFAETVGAITFPFIPFNTPRIDGSAGGPFRPFRLFRWLALLPDCTLASLSTPPSHQLINHGELHSIN
ncbi:Putative transferase caf17, mitochondrial [Frankliniella fusca]|uniref:Transferase caf17, mitochondrial n=1 Tax=Frankliniella fusca TaxID=407009 RepID=A0AAE1HCI0_9NEOP|nr:Putative transferase caf17, mitochondrial [Frankliniella fusca]